MEPDASSASYFWGAGWLLDRHKATRPSHIRIANWMSHSSQIDARFPEILARFPDRLSRQNDLGDSIMTAIVLAPFADSPKTFVNLERLRVQESERVKALHAELTKCGARISEQDDTLHITPGPLHGAEIETYDDHRIAMCFSLVALSGTPVTIRDPGCVAKTFPDYFERFAVLATSA